MFRTLWTPAVLAVALAASPALAQTADHKNSMQGSSKSLSSKLSESGGVIKPKGDVNNAK